MFQIRKQWLVVLGSIVLVALAASSPGALATSESGVRAVAGFDKVILGTSGRLIIAQGEQESLRIEARPGDLANIVTEVRDGTLVIGWRHGEPGFSLRPPEFRLTVKTVSGLQTSSSGSIEAASLRTDSLQVRITSSGSVSIGSLSADSLDVQIYSSGSFSAAGRVQQQNVVLTSSGSCQAGNLACASAKVVASSSGGATLRVSDSLQASVTSSGDVRYYGNPAVNANVTSSGRLMKVGT